MSFPSVENTGSLRTGLLMLDRSCPLCGECWTSQLTYLSLFRGEHSLPNRLREYGPPNWLIYVWSCPLCGECWTSQLTYLSLFCEEHSLLKRLREYGPPNCLTYVCIVCREYGQTNCCANWGHKKIDKQMLQIELKALLHFIKMARLACGIRLCNTSSPSLKTRDWRGFQIRSKKCRYFLNFTVL